MSPGDKTEVDMNSSNEEARINFDEAENHVKNIFHKLKTFYTERLLTDVIFTSGRSKIHAHLPIIQCFISCCKTSLGNEISAFCIPCAEDNITSIKLIAECCYTGKSVVPADLTSQFHAVAKLFTFDTTKGKQEEDNVSCFVIPKHQEILLQNLWQCREDCLNCDVMFVTNNCLKSHCHSFILGACSNYLLNIFLENFHRRERPFVFILPNVKCEDLEIVLEFCYKGSVNITVENTLSVYNTAKLLGIKTLCDRLSSLYPTVTEGLQQNSSSGDFNIIRTSFGTSQDTELGSTPIQQSLCNLLECESLLDVSIYVDGCKFEAHKVILSIFSAYFRTLFKNLKFNINHIFVLHKDFKIQHIQAFLDYIYKGKAQFPGDIEEFCHSMTEWVDFSLLPVSEKYSVVKEVFDTKLEGSNDENLVKTNCVDNILCQQEGDVVAESDNKKREDASDEIIFPVLPALDTTLQEEDETEGDSMLEEEDEPFGSVKDGETMTCQTCGKSYSNRQQFKQHMAVHPEAKVMKCKYCGKGFDKPSQMKLHVRTHTGSKPFQCDVCGMRFAAKSALTKHKKTHSKDTSKNYVCDICSKSFSRKEYVEEHLRTHTGSKPYECPICHKRFVGRTGLNHHKKIHTDSETKKTAVCEICGKSFTRHALWTHMKCHNKNHRCELCGKLFATTTALKLHVAGTHLGHVSHQCDICGKGFMQKNHLIRHMNTHNKESKDEEFSCENCDKRYKTQEKLQSHKVRVHAKPGDRPYSCNMCSKKFAGRSTVIYHRRAHTGEKPHACPTCGKMFSRPDALRQHLRSHSGNRNFDCPLCQKKCPSKSALTKHLSSHKNLDSKGTSECHDAVSCEECGKTFISEQELCNHVSTHASSRPHRCTICRKSFRYMDSLVKHSQIHATTNNSQLVHSTELPSLFSFHVCSSPYEGECQKKNCDMGNFATQGDGPTPSEEQQFPVTSEVLTNTSTGTKNTQNGNEVPRRPFSITIDGNLCCNSDVLVPADGTIVTLVPAIPQELNCHVLPGDAALQMGEEHAVTIAVQNETTNVSQATTCFSTVLSKSFDLQSL